MRAPPGGAVRTALFAALLGPQVRIGTIGGRCVHPQPVAGGKVEGGETGFLPSGQRDVRVDKGMAQVVIGGPKLLQKRILS